MISWLLSRVAGFYNTVEKITSAFFINLKFRWQLNNFFLYKKHLYTNYIHYYNVIVNCFIFYFKLFNWYPLIKKNGYLNNFFENSKKIIKYNKKK